MLAEFGPLPQVDLLTDMATYPFTAFPVKDHRAYRLHSHGTLWELVVVTHGRGRHLLDQDSYAISPGDVFFIPSGRLHGYADCHRLGLFNAILDPARLELPTAQLQRIPGYNALVSLEPQLRRQHHFESRLHLAEDALQEVTSQLWEMYQELLTKKAGYQLLVTSLFTVLLGKLARRYAELDAPSSQGLTRLGELLAWLDRHYHEQIGLADLLRHAHMAPSTLERHFHAAFGMAPWAYVRNLRLRKAMALLTNTNASIGEIAVQVGMKDANYFSRAFVKYTGVSPREYRRRSEGDAGLAVSVPA
jgi:AraC-like DNA-binding protein